MENKIIELIYQAIDDLNLDREPGDQIVKSEDTVFLGQNSVLDSLALIDLIVSLEGNINDEFNVGVTLADERAMIVAVSPFRTVGSTAKFIETQIAAAKNI